MGIGKGTAEKGEIEGFSGPFYLSDGQWPVIGGKGRAEKRLRF